MKKFNELKIETFKTVAMLELAKQNRKNYENYTADEVGNVLNSMVNERMKTVYPMLQENILNETDFNKDKLKEFLLKNKNDMKLNEDDIKKLNDNNIENSEIIKILNETVKNQNLKADINTTIIMSVEIEGNFKGKEFGFSIKPSKYISPELNALEEKYFENVIEKGFRTPIIKALKENVEIFNQKDNFDLNNSDDNFNFRNKALNECSKEILDKLDNYDFKPSKFDNFVIYDKCLEFLEDDSNKNMLFDSFVYKFDKIFGNSIKKNDDGKLIFVENNDLYEALVSPNIDKISFVDKYYNLPYLVNKNDEILKEIDDNISKETLEETNKNIAYHTLNESLKDYLNDNKEKSILKYISENLDNIYQNRIGNLRNHKEFLEQNAEKFDLHFDEDNNIIEFYGKSELETKNIVDEILDNNKQNIFNNIIKDFENTKEKYTNFDEEEIINSLKINYKESERNTIDLENKYLKNFILIKILNKNDYSNDNLKENIFDTINSDLTYNSEKLKSFTNKKAINETVEELSSKYNIPTFHKENEIKNNKDFENEKIFNKEKEFDI